MKSHVDFINDYDGPRMTLNVFCERYAQWERKNLSIGTGSDDYEYPVLSHRGDAGNSYVLIHTQGALFVYPQAEGHWDHDPDLNRILDEYSQGVT